MKWENSRTIKCSFLPPAWVNGSDQKDEQKTPRDRRRTGQVAVRPPMTVNTSSFSREQIVASYINVYFPDDITGTTELDPWYTLLSGISALPNKSVMLEKAMAATSCIYLGKINDDTRMLNHGLQLYNGAIHRVSQELSRNNYTDELFFYNGDFHDTGVHQTAVTNGIFKNILSHSTNSPIIKTLCLAFQRMRLLKSLSPIEANNVVDLAREHAPTAVTSHENVVIDELFQLMADISPIAAAVSMTDVSDNTACHLSLYDCLAHREKLLSWYSRAKVRIGGGPYVGESSDFPCKNILPSEHLFGRPYGFSSLDNARIHILFWSALSILQALLGQTHAYAYTSAPPDPYTNKEYQLSEYYADEISRAMPYCLQDSMKAWGISMTIFGMGQIAKVYMELRREEKFLWSQHLFKYVGDMGSDLGYRVGELLQFGWSLLEQSDRNERPELSSVASSPGSNASSASPVSPASSTSTASTAPFVAEYVPMHETIDLPTRSRWEPDR
ncbi:hypothetical protein N7533_013784 [Penicillium manginii]|uniref:uncharacterized protein n=1 Tax=Penicillium manginii TaxID=203109 RepID=UPI00254800E8|nr:uncharacterized protein N7533_013784 [Penicillium manginii]KAJ5733337.1 hypothetical protein N7533_013784 [Penicillium manginii]